MTRSLSIFVVALLLGFVTPTFAQEPSAPTEYGTVHAPAPEWLKARFARVESTLFSPSWAGPAVDRSLVREFLHSTYEHINEVNALSKALGGRPRPLPANAGPEEILRGVHDFGERVSLARLDAWVEQMKTSPPKGSDGRALKVPRWVLRLPAEARATGLPTFDVGKLSPYVVAGLSRNGNSDPFAIELHRLSAHHMYQGRHGAPRGNLLFETIADKINAMRQIRIYRPTALPFAKIGEILRGDMGKGLPADSGKLIDRAVELQSRLERTGRVNPYHLAGRKAARAPLLERYRRADGTLDWKRLRTEGALREAGGLAQFGMALFLKELAVVAASGDRLRVGEFFDGLATTEFYAQYGLFAVGARGGELAYGRYLERFVKPRFLRGILRTQLVMAAGLALPQLVNGEFSGKTFAISLTSLGLSSSAVRGGVAGIKWVTGLDEARRAGVLGGALAAKRWVRVGGWFYTAAELAVVLYLAEGLEHRINAALDLRAARSQLADAGQALIRATAEPSASPKSVADAASTYGDAWAAYREFLYRPLLADEAVYSERLARLAREAKIGADERKAALERLKSHPSLAANVVARYGSLERFASERARRDEANVQKDVIAALDAYDRARAGHLREIYTEGRRGNPLLDDVADLDWLLAGAPLDAFGDPRRGRTDTWARLGRGHSRRGLRDALTNASENRLEAYADEAEVLERLADSLRRRGDGALADPLDVSRARIQRVETLERAFFEGGAEALGAAGALEAAGR